MAKPRTKAAMAVCAALASVFADVPGSRAAQTLTAELLDQARVEVREGTIGSAVTRLTSLVDGRWRALDDRQRYEASTLLMLALTISGRRGEAETRGGALHAAMPALFLNLGRPEEPDALAAAIRVLGVRSGHQNSIVYLHNASDRQVLLGGLAVEIHDLRISYARSRMGVATASRSLDEDHFVSAIAGRSMLELPAGRGVILESVGFGPGPDASAVLADLAQQHIPAGWTRERFGTYAQSFARLRVTSGSARWGFRRLHDLALLDVAGEAPASARAAAGASPGSPATLDGAADTELQRGIGLLFEGDYEAAADVIARVATVLEGQAAGTADLARAYMHLGVAKLYSAGESEALAAFRRAQENDPRLGPGRRFPRRVLRLWEDARGVAPEPGPNDR